MVHRSRSHHVPFPPPRPLFGPRPASTLWSVWSLAQGESMELVSVAAGEVVMLQVKGELSVDRIIRWKQFREPASAASRRGTPGDGVGVRTIRL